MPAQRPSDRSGESLRAEVRAELGHLSGLIRAEFGQLRHDLVRELADLNASIADDLDHRHQRLVRRLVAAQLIIVIVACMAAVVGLLL